MKTRNRFTALVFSTFALAAISCKQEAPKETEPQEIIQNKVDYVSFSDDVAFMKNHTEIITLSDPSGNAKVALAPALQGRVMTSAADGDNGRSFGWINRSLFSSGEEQEHIHIYGGEERFWLGPEGGQYSIFFEKGAEFTLEDWYTPKLIDTEPFDMKSSSSNKAVFTKEASLVNYSGFQFDLAIEREIAVLSQAAIQRELGLAAFGNSIKAVAYQTTNTLSNTGEVNWDKKTGLLSIWLLGMYNASPATTVVIPFVPGSENDLGKPVTDDYFGKVPGERLIVKDSLMYFSGDAKFRSKIGLSPSRSKDLLGSYDAASKVLTIVKYNKPLYVSDYVNSLWQIQEEPYAGDVINSYNDGPPAPGEDQLGQFYELETSSPALELKAGKSATHVQITCHFQGSETSLNELSEQLLGVSLNEIKSIFETK